MGRGLPFSVSDSDTNLLSWFPEGGGYRQPDTYHPRSAEKSPRRWGEGCSWDKGRIGSGVGGPEKIVLVQAVHDDES